MLHGGIPSARFGIVVEEDAAGFGGSLYTSVDHHKSREEGHRMLFATVWGRS